MQETLDMPVETGVKRIEINAETPSVLICTYGTLRKGRTNFMRFLENRCNYLGTYSTERKYTMYNMGMYPIVVDKGNSSIVYDLFEIRSRHVLENIHHLEGCTGIPGHPDNWYDIQKIVTPHGIAYMYLQHEEPNAVRYNIITQGDWNFRFTK